VDRPNFKIAAALPSRLDVPGSITLIRILIEKTAQEKKMKSAAILIVLLVGVGLLGYYSVGPTRTALEPSVVKRIAYHPREPGDTSGFMVALTSVLDTKDYSSLEEIRQAYSDLGYRRIKKLDAALASGLSPEMELKVHFTQAALYAYEGNAREVCRLLEQVRDQVTASDELAEKWLYSVIFMQGVAGLRLGESENCVDCRGEGACIFPLRSTAVHTKPEGSRLAIKHFSEYLQQFPDDLAVRWLLNLAYMTLGEHPDRVPGEHRLTFERFGSEFDIGRFRDISHLVGVDRVNQAGGAVMDDFDNDGLLDIITTSWDPGQCMAFYRNKGDGTFEERAAAAGLSKQFGGLNLVQTDYNNDGFLDLFVVRGAWTTRPMRPSLLRNNGNGTFTDVTSEAGLMAPTNAITATWADYDNDGFLDLFLCSEVGPHRLYRNLGNGTFKEVAGQAGVQGKQMCGKGANWLDYDNDGYPDLFVNYLRSTPQLFHNNRDGTFSDVTTEMGITGPFGGFSCWAFDYDNDGWLDIFATCYERPLADVVSDLSGQPARSAKDVTRLFHNLGGKRFVDVSKETGIDRVFVTMGSNFGDFDNDGYVDFYLGTGDPSYDMLVPNRMFKNVQGKRFAEITVTAGTGHLQKGHGIACGDWDRDGNVDIFMETGGATPGDRFHNVLFQNPGHDNRWLTVKLVGKKTNRPALGARIKVVTSGPNSLTVQRHVSSGSSFGGNPFQQTIGLGDGKGIDRLEIYWPTSQTTQVFRNLDVNQAIEVTELASDFRKLNWPRINVPAK
jgi:hypothetical protein